MKCHIGSPEEMIEEADRVSRIWRGDNDAEKFVDAALERIRKETPRFPRWFVCDDVYHLSTGRHWPQALARHRDHGLADLFIEGTWTNDVSHRWTLAMTLRAVEKGYSREVSRADAFAWTGGNP
jgi:hypothetical protein